MHGPCGHLNPECPCMKHLKSKGSCKYVYPKHFRSETTNNGDGYPMYRRRDTGDSAFIRKATLDNKWVIPYNPYLSALFDCHLNVEVCSTVEAVKYLYKYVYKGMTRSRSILGGGVDTIDEIEHYQSGRWVSACHGHLKPLTVDGYRCASFQEAAIKLRLLEEDDAIDKCLAEACEVQMPPAVRRLFSTVLIFCQPSDPNALWLKYYAALSEDFSHKFPNFPEKVRHLTARAVEQYLEAMGKSLKAFGLEHLQGQEDDELRRTKDIVDALDPPIPQDCIDCRLKLNLAQQKAFDIVLPTATSGIAASNIPSGRTAHSRFKIPIDSDASLACDVPKQGSLAALIRAASLIIWDEASMARKENVESLDMLLRDLCDATLSFGGNGELQTEENGFVLLPSEIVSNPRENEDPINEITSVAFPELDMNEFTTDIFTTRAILTPINDDLDSINLVLMEKFPGQAVIYKSFDTILDDNCAIYPTEFINKLCPGGMSPHELVLKENCPVILLRNILPSAGLCNGTRLICKRFFPNIIECVITTGHHKGEHVLYTD
ncbi:uncharacterized protein LOC104899124 [Beta vulgaris subsp. vulgaris]|uniref:uncharacterized protein LOC104899124 n=1 Tax=Beta vulgaris subsp. vulgaris TaxID=3555 RepID=UPI0025471BA8|nr:uncharacterized protein LOC104899124 [Beta vulgaris subsp. vulgaris]